MPSLISYIKDKIKNTSINTFNFFIKIVILLLIPHSIYAQKSDGNEKFRNEVAKNTQLFKQNIDAAFNGIDNLIHTSIVLEDHASELLLIDRKCRYYYSKNDVNSLIINAKQLQNKAIQYHHPQMETMAHVYKAEAYSINKLFDRAILELEAGYVIIEKLDADDPKVFFTKSNLLNSLANVYNDNGKPEMAVEKIKLSIKNDKALKEVVDKNSYQHLNYSNLAAIYVHINIDSAAYYAQRSIDIIQNQSAQDKAMVTNYAVLAEVAKSNKQVQLSIDYYLKAYEIAKGSGEILNLESIYENLIANFYELGDTVRANELDKELKDYQLNVVQSKYNSLQKVVNDASFIEKKNSNLLYLYLFLAFVIMVVTMFLLYRQNLKRKIKEKKEKEALKIYPYLIETIKHDDDSFLLAFQNSFPGFTDKLLKIDANLSRSEIEFCAFLKLNLSTKKISQLKFIEIRTVQNKKYKIRKKLKMPQDIDIYKWIAAL